ncbi:Oxysterol-binding protein-related protein 2B [Clarias magur]|uniref:Oxysterol-binding protein-related protein 2B n=1 Tax=Clarias magur TaxID=1594786 RepID=A0A8J4XJB1_CLAMG|nr:Oxysterol-binding protein-related protein 2B [Clarias magur]
MNLSCSAESTRAYGEGLPRRRTAPFPSHGVRMFSSHEEKRPTVSKCLPDDGKRRCRQERQRIRKRMPIILELAVGLRCTKYKPMLNTLNKVLFQSE